MQVTFVGGSQLTVRARSVDEARGIAAELQPDLTVCRIEEIG